MVYRVISTKWSSNSPNYHSESQDQAEMRPRILVFHADLSYNCMLFQAHNVLPISSISVSTKRLIFVLNRKRTTVFKVRILAFTCTHKTSLLSQDTNGELEPIKR